MNREQLLQEKLKVLNELLTIPISTPENTKKTPENTKTNSITTKRTVQRTRQKRKLTYKQQEQLKYDILYNNYSNKKIKQKYNIDPASARCSIINNNKYIHVPAIDHKL